MIDFNKQIWLTSVVYDKYFLNIYFFFGENDLSIFSLP
jgi:hypothetical protein